MEIRDVIHGAIEIGSHERPILDSRYFQRLRQIKQLGFGENAYPSATHNRYIHSLGAMHTASSALKSIFKQSVAGKDPSLAAPELERFLAVTRLAALLHDVGHGPLSHTTEFAMPAIKDLGPIPGFKTSNTRQATHEDYTLKIVLDSGLTPLLEKAGRTFGFTPRHVAALIEPSIAVEDDFFETQIDGVKTSIRPLLQQLISSELDADRMDYLRRDSWHAGVSYGVFDFDWVMRHLAFHVRDGKCFLAIEHRALYAFEDFLISRFHMFLMVYFHYKSVVFDEMLKQFLASPDSDYKLPADIEAYCGCDDAHLYSHLAKSSNPWAKRIVSRKPYRMLVELHSGIPATEIASKEQDQLFASIQKDLTERKISHLSSTSTGELSKYFRKPADPIFVRYDNHYSAPSHIRLEQCTDLFKRYEEKRSISRLYVDPERYAECRSLGRGKPLKYEEPTDLPTG